MEQPKEKTGYAGSLYKELEKCLYAETPILFKRTNSDEKYWAVVRSLEPHALKLEFEEPPPQHLGSFAVHANISLFQWDGRLIREKEHLFQVHFPVTIRVVDRRRCPRIPVEDEGQDIEANLFIPKKEEYKPLHLLDMSATGIQVELPSSRIPYRLDDTLQLAVRFQDMSLAVTGQVVRIQKESLGIKFIDLDTETKLALNRKVVEGLDQHEALLLNRGRKTFQLREKLRWMKKMNEMRADREHLPEELLELIRPVLEDVSEALQLMGGSKLEQKDLKLDLISKGLYDVMVSFQYEVRPLKGRLYLCLHNKDLTLFGIESLPENPTEARALLEAKATLLDEMLIKVQKGRHLPVRPYRVTRETPLHGPLPVLGALSRQLFLRVEMASDHADPDYNVSLEGLTTHLQTDLAESVRNFLFDMDTLDRVMAATRCVFQQHLQIQYQERGVELQPVLRPKFKASTVQFLKGKNFRGIMVLDVSDKLSLAIHKHLTGEDAGVVTEAVHNSVSEVLNMINGNSSRFSTGIQLGYSVAPPLIPKDKDDLIKRCRNKAFVQDIFSSTHGLFEVCIALYAT